MTKNVTIELDTRVLDGLIKRSGGNVAKAVAKVGFAIEARAKVNAPVDTGALRASIYTSLKNGETSAIARAQALNPDAQTVPLPTPQDSHTAYVGPSVEYGASVELGTARRAPTPFLLPAVRATEKEFAKFLEENLTNHE